jgi:hypothetical protein
MTRALAALAALLALPVPAAALDLAGTWHVLVHYKDSQSTHPERERWEDRVWVFATQGDRLEWTDYPIVVFADESGRFERLGGNRASRVLAHWEPSPAQLAQIREGLEINPRGSKTKTLRQTPGGWTSSTGRPGYQSARFITYQETWTVEGLPDAPVFTFDDVLGSASAESFEGRTRYETTAVEEGGALLRGDYERDGAREGTFRMMRSGAVSTVKGSGKTQGERALEAGASQLGLDRLFAGPRVGAESALREKIEAGEFTAQDREELSKTFEATLEEFVEGTGNDARALRPKLKRLADEMTRLFVEENKSTEDLRGMLQRGELRP